MCTVSVVGWGGGLRLACNRDELLSRPIAIPPVIRLCGDRSALLPLDPQPGGTWIAVNDAGVAFVILNVNPRPVPDPSPRLRSRGTIIPALLQCDDAAQAAAAMTDDLNPDDFPPFRLIALDRQTCAEFTFDGQSLATTCRPFDGEPLMYTSSGLGDALVERPRRELFDRIVRSAEACPRRQDEFHLHRWLDRPHLSVLMNRADARTVSRTVIDVSKQRARMQYFADGVEHIYELRTLQRAHSC
jgi:Transport and Golgi organisation 2